MAELKIGQAVWVKSVLRSGVFFERKIYEIENGLGGDVTYCLSRGGINASYHESDLIINAKEAKEICRKALEDNFKKAKNSLDSFIVNEILWQSPTSLAWS